MAYGCPIGLLQLAENLRFAEYHRIQAASDFQRMSYRGFFVKRVAVGGDDLTVQLLKAHNPVQRLAALGVGDITIQFSPVASRKNRGLVNAGCLGQGLQSG